jgi:hypothetical protein
MLVFKLRLDSIVCLFRSTFLHLLKLQWQVAGSFPDGVIGIFQ